MSLGEQLVRDFVAAARLLAVGETDAALRRLLPEEVSVQYRLPRILAAGALVTGTVTGGASSTMGTLGRERLTAADADAIRELLTWLCRGAPTGVLVDALVVVLVAFAHWELLPTAVRMTTRPTVVATCPQCDELISGRPPAAPSPATAGGRPVP